METGGRWAGLGVRLGWRGKAENSIGITIKLEKKKKRSTNR